MYCLSCDGFKPLATLRRFVLSLLERNRHLVLISFESSEDSARVIALLFHVSD